MAISASVSSAPSSKYGAGTKPSGGEGGSKTALAVISGFWSSKKMVSDWSEEEVALRGVRVVGRLRKEKEMVGREEVMREVGVWREREEREERADVVAIGMRMREARVKKRGLSVSSRRRRRLKRTVFNYIFVFLQISPNSLTN